MSNLSGRLTQQAQTEAETDRAELLLKQADSERDRRHDELMLDLKYKYELVKYAQERQVDLATAIAQINAVGAQTAAGAGNAGQS